MSAQAVLGSWGFAAVEHGRVGPMPMAASSGGGGLVRFGDVPPGGDPPAPPPALSADPVPPLAVEPTMASRFIPLLLGYVGALGAGAAIGYLAQGGRAGAATGALTASALWSGAETYYQLRLGRPVLGASLLALSGTSAVLAVRRKPGGWRR